MYAFAGPIERVANAMHERRARSMKQQQQRLVSTFAWSGVRYSSSTATQQHKMQHLTNQTQQQHSLFYRISSATTSTTLSWWSMLLGMTRLHTHTLLPFAWPLRVTAPVSTHASVSSLPTPTLPSPPHTQQLSDTPTGPTAQGVGASANSKSMQQEQQGLKKHDGVGNYEPQQQPPATEQERLLSRFLVPADAEEIRYASLLSDLSNAAYDITSRNLAALQTKYRLSLVSTSSSCACGPVCRTDWEAEAASDRQASIKQQARKHAVLAPPTAQQMAQDSMDGSIKENSNTGTATPTSPGTIQQDEQGSSLDYLDSRTQSSTNQYSSSNTEATTTMIANDHQGSMQHNTTEMGHTQDATLPPSYPPTPDISHTPEASRSPAISPPPSRCRSPSSSSLVADAPPPALSPSVTLVSLSTMDESVGMAMMWPDAFHYPLLTHMPRACAPTPTRRRSVDGTADDTIAPAQIKPKTKLVAAEAEGVRSEQQLHDQLQHQRGTDHSGGAGFESYLGDLDQLPNEAAAGHAKAPDLLPQFHDLEVPGTPPQQVEHQFNQKGYSPPQDLELPNPPLSAPALRDNIEVTELEFPHSPQADALVCSTKPPCDWFVCDDEATNIRYIVIQGSITLQHWQINLQFDPVIFEDPAYGVRVHRGVYEAALKLYGDMVPLVRQHLACGNSPSKPPPRIVFTGHSLGGSLSTIMTLLLVHRGAVRPEHVAPAYTFGAPAVFCGGEDEAAMMPAQCGHDQQQQQEEAQQGQEQGRVSMHGAPHGLPPVVTVDTPAVNETTPVVTASTPVVNESTPAGSQSGVEAALGFARCSLGLLQRLGLMDRHFVNIIMHRDIVPRAFVCDYALVADLLKQWLPSFKSHPPLQGAHKSLYNFLGGVAVLKPDLSSPFVQPADAGHPLLPDMPGLFHLRNPRPLCAPVAPSPTLSSATTAVLAPSPSASDLPAPTPTAATAQPKALPPSASVSSSPEQAQAMASATQTPEGTPLHTQDASLTASSLHNAAHHNSIAVHGPLFGSVELKATPAEPRSHPQEPGHLGQEQQRQTSVQGLGHASSGGSVSDDQKRGGANNSDLDARSILSSGMAAFGESQGDVGDAASQTRCSSVTPESTVQAAAAAVAAAVHAQPAEAHMGNGSLADQATLASAAVAAAAAATAFSNDALAHSPSDSAPLHDASTSSLNSTSVHSQGTQQQQRAAVKPQSNNILATGGAVRRHLFNREPPVQPAVGPQTASAWSGSGSGRVRRKEGSSSRSSSTSRGTGEGKTGEEASVTVEEPPHNPQQQAKGEPHVPMMTLQEATLLFLNSPHPLTTLSEYASYGHSGTISRYHNPDNYTKGLVILAEIADQKAQQQHRN